MDFKGDPTPLDDGDYERAARELGCTVAAIRAVAQVESAGGGYFRDKRPKILFERHIFYRECGKRFTGSHPHLSWPKSGGYLRGAREYDRLEEAMTLDRDAALKSASWGKFQVMGFNHVLVGFPDLDTFIAAMIASEEGHLQAFLGYIKAVRLDDELRRLDWAGFARGYNGRDFRRNRYDEKMADAYRLFSRGGARTDNPTPLLKLGARGQAVMHLQELLGIVQDGDFGPATKAAVVEFQQDNDLYADGIVGGQTWTKLLAKSAGSSANAPAPEATRQPLRQGDRGDDVKLLQKVLGLKEDGIFGAATAKAVIDFQKDNGLKKDGIVGRKTWAKLVGD